MDIGSIVFPSPTITQRVYESSSGCTGLFTFHLVAAGAHPAQKKRALGIPDIPNARYAFPFEKM